MIGYIFYSHFEYSDVWPIMKGQVDKFFKDKRKIFFTNEIGSFDFSDWEVVLYDDSLPYQKRVAACLEKIDDEFVIIHQEDMIFTKQPDFNIIENDLLSLVKNGDLDLIKFCKACYIDRGHVRMGKNLFKNPDNLSYAVQPTLGRKKTIHNISNNTLGSSIWRFEANSSNTTNFLNYKSAYYYEGNERKRGMYHWDSSIYPYLNSGILKGRWDFSMYREELSELLNDHGVDPLVRGVYE